MRGDPRLSTVLKINSIGIKDLCCTTARLGKHNGNTSGHGKG